MNIHEYQAKDVMRKFGVEVLDGKVAHSAKEAKSVAESLGGDLWVVKAQIHAGGRGKAGGVKLAKSLNEVEQHAKELLGKTLVTHQTGPEGKVVHKIFVEKGCDIEKEFYLGIVLDRTTSRLVVMASSEGGVDIEEVAKNSPEKIVKASIDPAQGFTPYVSRKLVYGMGLGKAELPKFHQFLSQLYKLYVETECSIAEINPLVITKQGDVIALDAKLNFDENALFRHSEIKELRDPTEESPEEIEAGEYGLSYIKLDGTIGCLVNGAGLAMGTMDIIQLHGGSPANFLDVGGSANKEAVTKAFTIILRDKNVNAILVNIFGGIMKCDIIAEGVISAAKELSLKVPLVVRLEGTNVELGRKILSESGLKITTATDLEDAAVKVVEAAKAGES